MASFITTESWSWTCGRLEGRKSMSTALLKVCRVSEAPHTCDESPIWRKVLSISFTGHQQRKEMAAISQIDPGSWGASTHSKPQGSQVENTSDDGIARAAATNAAVSGKILWPNPQFYPRNREGTFQIPRGLDLRWSDILSYGDFPIRPWGPKDSHLCAKTTIYRLEYVDSSVTQLRSNLHRCIGQQNMSL
jgi:hypothetical protein